MYKLNVHQFFGNKLDYFLAIVPNEFIAFFMKKTKCVPSSAFELNN